jgi:hypothetical protein
MFTPHALRGAEVRATIDDYVRCAVLSRLGGYDGVEVMGSEGYLINQVDFSLLCMSFTAILSYCTPLLTGSSLFRVQTNAQTNGEARTKIGSSLQQL